MTYEELINKLLELLKEGKFEEYQQTLIENLNMFPPEIREEIIRTLIESYLINETEKLRKINDALEEFAKELKEINKYNLTT